MFASSVGGLDRLGHAGLIRRVEPADIHREDQVGRAVAPLLLEPGDEPGRRIHHVDLDAGLARERVEQRLHQKGLPIGVDVDLLVRRGGMSSQSQGKCGGGRAGRKLHWGASHRAFEMQMITNRK